MTSNPSSSFSVSYDSLTKFISAAICVAVLVAGVTTRSIWVGCLLALVIVLSYAYSPRGYIVSEGSLFVRRLIGKVCIGLEAVQDVRAANPEDLRGCLRLFGNGGLFGYYGLFRTSKLGKCSWYVTNRENAVVLVTRTKTTVLSPDDVNSFVMTIRAMAAMLGAQRSEAVSCSTQPSRCKGITGKLTAVAIGILLIFLVVGSLLYSPGPPKYTLTPEELAIHDRFFPITVKGADVDVERIQVVDIGTDAHWRPTMRTNGFANAHYRAGWFRVAGGEKVRMYRADGRRLVLLPPKGEGTPVLIEVGQPEAFIREVRQAWR
jgi:hypothetical protein